MSKANFITTSIPYVNAKPHVGFALELVQADAYARYLRLKGDDVFLQSGTDENSLKNVLAARERGVPVKSHVDEHVQHFRDLGNALTVNIDRFVRTTSDEHVKTVQDFWRRLRPDDLYKAKYAGLYCVGCEDFWKEEDLLDGLCPDHLQPPEAIEEENIYFRLSRYQGEIRRLIEGDKIRITPSFRKKEILNFIDRGLNDISISRSKTRSQNWGITVPGEEDQIIYVWIDALLNYLAGGSWKNETRKVHFIGKNLWKFHAIYWPALLLSAGLPLPDEIFAHGFLTIDGQKISKSLGNSVDPFGLIERFGADSLRFYLLRSFSPFDDGDFSVSALKAAHNTYLVNGLGNLVSGLKTLAARQDTKAQSSTEPIVEFASALDCFRFDEGLKALWREIDRINLEISALKPWEDLDSRRSREAVARWLTEVSRIGYWLSCLLPGTGAKVIERVRTPQQNSEHLFKKWD